MYLWKQITEIVVGSNVNSQSCSGRLNSHFAEVEGGTLGSIAVILS